MVAPMSGDKDTKDGSRRRPPDRKSSEAEIERLNKAFEATPEMQERARLVERVHKALRDEHRVSVRITVDPAFYEMIKFIEQRSARRDGRAPESERNVLSRRLNFMLHDQLHWLAADPTYFAIYRDLWNRLCDERGLPDQNISDEGMPGPA
jgi:hypothetical protein